MKFKFSSKFTVFRVILTIIIILLLIFPFYRVGVNFSVFFYDNITVDIRYIIAGILFIFAFLANYIDKTLSKKKNDNVIFSQFLDIFVDKMLVDSVLIAFAASGYISVIIPVVVVIRDLCVDIIRMNLIAKGRVLKARTSGKIKTATLMIGILLTFFYNLPFEVWNLEISTAFLYFGTVMSVISLFDYYYANKKILIKDIENNE